jgi:hypothetical protein
MILLSSFFQSPGIFSGGTNGAITVKFQFMVEDPEPLLTGDAELKRFNTFALEFYDFAAGQADQVVMVGTFRVMLKTGHAVSEPARRSPTAFAHQFQRPVHCGISNPGTPLADLVVKLIDAQVGTRFYKEPGDLLSLPGGLETPLL